ncbi:MAG TPA: FCD domain-containing protein [Pseudonocardiaceae bacterium]|nr:FCD domain-containing protein [Pseudonocardiaceae bacterium]
MRVAQLSPQDVDELFSLREVLERFAVQFAPLVPEPLALAELADRLEVLRQAAATGATLEQAEAHRRFHLALVAMAGSTPSVPGTGSGSCNAGPRSSGER